MVAPMRTAESPLTEPHEDAARDRAPFHRASANHRFGRLISDVK
jgi:hypothetical protein